MVDCTTAFLVLALVEIVMLFVYVFDDNENMIKMSKSTVAFDSYYLGY